MSAGGPPLAGAPVDEPVDEAVADPAEHIGDTTAGPGPGPELRRDAGLTRLEASRRRRVNKAVQRRARSRWAIHYDTEGATVRLGVIWFALVIAAIAVPRLLGWPHQYGRIAVGGLYSLVAFFAGRQAARAWREHGEHANSWVAGLGAAAIGAAAVAGTGSVGIVVLILVFAALAAGTVESRQSSSPMDAAAATIRSGLVVGLAAASVSGAYRIDIGALIVLVLLVMIYEAGDFLVGSGAANVVEGPIAGMLGVMVVAFALSVFEPPPFDSKSIWLFSALLAVLCPLGGIAGSAALPRSDASARALRRLDALAIAGPVYFVALWGYTH